PRSYKELPMRMGELGLVHRNERSGTLHGLMRVRSFTQDDAHILMRENQVMDGIQGVMRLIDEVYRKFGFSYEIELSTRPEHSIGRTWQCGTIQLDFQLPQRFDIDYIGADGEKHRPIMLHRVVFGSIERFIGILLEHYAGALEKNDMSVSVRQRDAESDKQDMGEMSLEQVVNLVKRGEME
ncbi:MAG: threonine--tRNA ligase, partial [Lachnospiraceae bacterium]|nr:threonine--tRNA ligase [Lachnospiraceae bacterium]